MNLHCIEKKISLKSYWSIKLVFSKNILLLSFRDYISLVKAFEKWEMSRLPASRLGVRVIWFNGSPCKIAYFCTNLIKITF